MVVNKASLGIVPDSIEKSFVEFNPRYTLGYLGGFGYRSAAGRPLLDHPLESVRYTLPSLTQDSTAWRTSYDSLVNQLPPDLQARFLKERELPFEQRNLSFVALDNVLTMGAKVLTRANQLGQTDYLDPLAETRTTLNILLPFAALKGAISNGNETLSQAKDFLMTQGANYRYFDGFNSLISQWEASLTLLQQVNSSLADTVNGQLTPQAVRNAAKAAFLLGTVGAQIEHISLGNDLQMLLPSIRAMETIASALSLKSTLTAPLFLAAAWGSLGITSTDNSLRVVGSQLQTLANTLSAGLIAGIMPPSNKAGNEFLSLMTTLSLTTFIGLAGLTVDSGLGLYPSRSEQDVQAARFFAFESAVQLLVNSGTLETFYQEIIAASGGNTEAQRLGSTTLANAAYLLIALEGAQEAKKSPIQLMEDQSQSLQQGLFSAGEIEAKAATDHTSIAHAIQLLTIALESRDYEGFQGSLNTVLEGIGIAPESLPADLTAIHEIGKAIVGGSDDKNLDPNMTTIIHVM